MFEISDDDEEFWEDFPLDSITDQKERTVFQINNNSNNKRKRIEEVDTIQNQSNEQHIRPENSNNVQADPSRSFSYKKNCNELEALESSGDPVQMVNSVNKNSKPTPFFPKSRESSNTCGFFTPVKKSPPTKPQSSKSRFSSNSGSQLMPQRSPVKDDVIVGHVTPVRRVKRKFPGPAGRLPKLRPGQPLEKLTAKSPETDDKLPKTAVISSQSVDDGFNESSWQTLLEDLGDGAEMILDQFSVASSLQQASKKILPKGKIPLLLVMIESIDLQGAGASVVLKDKTGRIKGTLHRDVIKEYGSEIQTGTSLVLRQVSVVSPTSRSHYVNITRNNIVYLNSNNFHVKKHLFHQNSLPQFISDFQKHYKRDIPTETPCANGGHTFIGTENQTSLITQNRQVPGSVPVPQFNSSASSSVARNQPAISNHGNRFSPCVPATNSAPRETVLHNFPRSSLKQNISGAGGLTPNSIGNSFSIRLPNFSSVRLNQTSDSRDITPDHFPNGNSRNSANLSSSFAKSSNEHKENEYSSLKTFNPRNNSTFSSNNAKDNSTAGQFKGDNSIRLAADCQNSTPKRSKFSFKSKTPSFSPKVNVAGVTSDRKLSSNKDEEKFEELWPDDITDELLSHLSEEMI